MQMLRVGDIVNNDYALRIERKTSADIQEKREGMVWDQQLLLIDDNGSKLVEYLFVPTTYFPGRFLCKLKSYHRTDLEIDNRWWTFLYRQGIIYQIMGYMLDDTPIVSRKASVVQTKKADSIMRDHLIKPNRHY